MIREFKPGKQQEGCLCNRLTTQTSKSNGPLMEEGVEVIWMMVWGTGRALLSKSIIRRILGFPERDQQETAICKGQIIFNQEVRNNQVRNSN